MVVSQVYDDWHQHGEGLVLISLQDVQEVVILEEAHSTVSNLQVDSSNALHDSLEKLRNKGLDFLDFTDFENFLQLSQEEGFLDTVSEGPVLKETFEKGNSKSSIFS